MGEKAKKAINEAEISLKSIQTALNDLVQHFQAYSVQKQGRAETAAKIVEHVKKKYPGAADTSVIPSTDQTGQAMLKGYLAMKEKGKGFKKDAQRDLIILDQNLVRGKNRTRRARQTNRCQGTKKRCCHDQSDNESSQPG